MLETFTEQRPDNHHEKFIKEKLPNWLTRASPGRRQELKRTPVSVPEWYSSASPASHTALAQAIKASWVSQNKVDRMFKRLADVRQFAEPLLRQALKVRFGIDVDVTKTFLRLYLPEGILVGYRVKTLSLLDAALRNFEAKERVIGYFDDASCFISEPNPSGQFEVLAVNRRLSVSAFVLTCRELDIGGQYSRQLEELLLPKDAMVKAVLELYVKTSQKDAFRAAVLLARMKGDIGADSQTALLHLLDGGTPPVLRSRVLHSHHVHMMDAKLTGIMLLAADLDRASSIEPVIVYIPDDPQHPLKEYPSTTAFMTELMSRLKAVAYQRFFARFVAHEQRGYFFATLNNPSAVIKWDARRVQGELWTGLYQDKLNKILNDARVIAMPTADADRKSRWDTWDRLEKVASVVLQVATLVAMPFVPFLGELMLAYTAYQLLDETFTGVLDWAEGRAAEAADHLLTIAETLAQLGAFAVAGAAVGKVLAIKPPSFVQRLEPVVLDDGGTRLWNPDLQPYESDVSLPDGSVPDELGLHHHAGATLLPLDGKVYEVGKGSAEGAWNVRHPQRANAYRPRLTHNGSGAWAHEVERPMQWQGAQLFRRLGQSAAEFSDVTARRILNVSGIDDAMLRHLHVHSRRPPALLEDTIRRFKLDQQMQTFIADMQSPDPLVYAKADPQIHRELLATQGVSFDAASRSQMVRWAQDNRAAWFSAREDAFELSSDPITRQMRQIFPKLPKTVAQELWREASAADRLHMHNTPGMTPRMAREVLFYLREVRLSRAYEGLYLDSIANEDTDILTLHMLETLKGWPADVRIEVRESNLAGTLLDRIGDPDAVIRKVLVREHRGYQAYGAADEHLHGPDTLYAAVLHALPDAQRKALGFADVGQGAELKEALSKQRLLPRPQLRALLGQPPLEAGARSPMRLALGRGGYLLGGGESTPIDTVPVEQRLRRLFPTAAEEALEVLRQEHLGAEPLVAMARLEAEYVTLVNDLQLWAGEVPSLDPQTGAALTAGDIATQKRNREAFAEVIQASWSRRLTVANPFDTGRFFSKLDILGDLPQLSAEFSHVSEFLLINQGRFLRGDAFLKSFPGLKFLTMRGIRLDSFPAETFQMRSLISLTLEDCNLRLTEATAEGLAHMEGLEELDLDKNPLGLTPYVGHMTGLSRLHLMSTGLTEAPGGLFSLKKLTFADLTFNQIEELPDELFDVSDTQPTNFNFCDNPLSAETRQRITEYNDNSSLDRKVLIQFEDELDVESDEADIDSSSEESGLGSDVESEGD